MVSGHSGARYGEGILKGLTVAGWIVVAIMMVWGTTDVIMQVFYLHLPATVPWTEVFNVIALALPLGYVTSKKAHITSEIFTPRGRTKRAIDIMSMFLVLVFMGLLTWQLSLQAWQSLRGWEFDQSEIKIYWFPAKIALAFGYGSSFILVFWQLIGELLRRNPKT